MNSLKPKRVVNPYSSGIGIVVAFYKGTCSHGYGIRQKQHSHQTGRKKGRE